ncbi:carbohydrate deacetylase-like [Saccostrea echinata]|uniref:carbohydrate deacetylase-like n=1 Tax=Saccostrea echinata TaxID=191078 RepID=UPI002A840E8E|nr:carbohydrate deacetylase-like [Saccostrea echinata]
MRKLLVINADDFGYSVVRNKGIVECFQEGAISGVTLMVNGVAAEDGARRAKEVGMPTGMHLNITEGNPIGKMSKTLTDDKGKFLGNFGFREALANGKIDLEEVKCEMKSQVDLFESLMGQKPSHVDGHQHAHLLPGICEIFGSVMKEHGVRSTRCPYEDLEPGHVYSWAADAVKDLDSFFKEVVQQAANAKVVMKENNIWATERFLGLQTMGSDMTVERLQRQITKAFNSTGNDVITCELMVHPGYKTGMEGGCGDGPDDFSRSPQREHEMSILRCKDMLEFYRTQGIEIVSFEQCFSP